MYDASQTRVFARGNGAAAHLRYAVAWLGHAKVGNLIWASGCLTQLGEHIGTPALNRYATDPPLKLRSQLPSLLSIGARIKRDVTRRARCKRQICYFARRGNEILLSNFPRWKNIVARNVSISNKQCISVFFSSILIFIIEKTIYFYLLTCRKIFVDSIIETIASTTISHQLSLTYLLTSERIILS